MRGWQAEIQAALEEHEEDEDYSEEWVADDEVAANTQRSVSSTSRPRAAAAAYKPPSDTLWAHQKATQVDTDTRARPRTGPPPAPTPAGPQRQRSRSDSQWAALEEQVASSASVVITGHVDSGKSTLIGRLLCDLGQVSDTQLRRLADESDAIGKATFQYAWILDEHSEERERGVTMDVAVRAIASPGGRSRLCLIDSPGHREFVPAMIRAAAMAELALLVVDARRGAFEAGFEADGQTREHARLLRSLGLQALVVAVNKMDACAYAEERYAEIVRKLQPFLEQALRYHRVQYVPCSGFAGQNVLTRATEPRLQAWWTQHPDRPSCVVEALEQLAQAGAASRMTRLRQPTRVVADAVSGAMLAGPCLSGAIAVGDELAVLSATAATADTVVRVRRIQSSTSGAAVPCLGAGGLGLFTVSPVDARRRESATGAAMVPPGALLVDPQDRAARLTSRWEAQVLVYDVERPLLQGQRLLLYALCAHGVPVRIRKMTSIPNAPEERPRPLRLARAHQTLSMQLELCSDSVATADAAVKSEECEQKPRVPLSVLEESRELGRFLLRYRSRTVAAGVVERILESGERAAPTRAS